MLSRLGSRLSAFFRATAPDPFVLAVLLTLLTIALALTLTDVTPPQVVAAWSADTGVWGLLAFAMQMCLILVTGHAVASSPPAAWCLARLAALPRTGAQAAALVAGVAALLGVLNWGLSLIGGAILAREVGLAMERRGVRTHYPLLAGAGFVGLMVWHGGLSGSAPLTMTTADQIARTFGPAAGAVGAPIPLTQTTFSPLNLVATGGLLVLTPLVFFFLHPRAADARITIQSAAEFLPATDDSRRTLTPAAPAAERKGLVPRLLEDTPVINLALGALIAWWALTYYFPRTGPSGVTRLTPNTVNLSMLLLALLLHWTPARFVAAVDEAARGCAGIVVQFPLYAGVMAVMSASGLTAIIVDAIAATSDARSLPILTFLAAGVVNMFIPSGGAQWAVQGPIALEAASAAGVSPARMVMAVAYGDQVTNMLQVFWALPLLAITRCKARDIVGYTAVAMLFAGAWLALCLLLF